MHDILDLERYPLDRPDTPEWQALVTSCRADLDAGGMFSLDGLMDPDVAADMAVGLQAAFATESFRHQRDHNIYFRKSVPGLADDHPALTRFHTSNDTLCGDQVAGSAADRLYHWPMFARFLAATMGKPALFPMDDPLAGLNVMSYGEGQALNWHFDRSEFTTTLLLQAPAEGGDFVYRTDLRRDDDPNYEGVARLLRGEDDQVQVLRLKPGTLNVFRGKNTPHRVTPVMGDRARVISVFSFFDTPGVRFTDDERIGFYGRAG
ncbi:HalD/BesD family halogenase [Phaeobacter marinintestinus]|uniref:HalD/BesD family halogenase n=1 Tax=Falsiphaeobacter marinintestinus TaxID=1492905 RepID=UPI0011B74465|nr:2OG-Fe(II) oxygenase [Phaeobacter marinintestinus]